MSRHCKDCGKKLDGIMLAHDAHPDLCCACFDKKDPHSSHIRSLEDDILGDANNRAIFHDFTKK